ncbi:MULTISPECIES: S8 family serine peptidase [Nocardioides]|uniref:S8 family serine peptidase n=1 Tax=Nocardioides vastitatis TaxID=2568655 RepID=A0ABW0ZG42_9ACTN|nr:S8 family serine peptidase [Nocardioides sp.]THI92104.1 serine protease [Nocardioides sp.]
MLVSEPGAQRARRLPAALALAIAALLALTAALGAPALADDPGPGADDGEGRSATKADLQRFKAGRYIVMLAAPPASTYSKTRAKPGKQFDARGAGVASYSRTLKTRHDTIARDLGFDVDRHFTIAANGFVADLTAKQATELATDRRVLIVQKDSLVYADTWNTPDFLGLTGRNGVWQRVGGQEKAGDGIVVGVIDSGIWPESRSFSGAPLTSKPKGRWKAKRSGTITSMRKSDGNLFRGECEVGEEFTVGACNHKLISARYFLDGYGEHRTIEEDYISPRDGNGHGTHTASTAAGNNVADVSTEGVDFGTVSGMAPGAKIASYKALWATADGRASGTTRDLVAAIEQAVTDGVDVINYSISGPTDTVLEAAEIAFEGAAEAGVFVAASAGNSGPGASTVAHNSPWVTTVAASTHTSFENTVVLGDGQQIVGASISRTALPNTPLVDAADAGNGSMSDADTSLCASGSLDPATVAGTIVVCRRGVYDRVAKSAEVERAGGAGMILANVTEGSLDADFHAVPTIHVSHTDSPAVYDYLDSAGAAATARFELGNLSGEETPVPQIAGFSSRGPAASDESDLLKPDIAAPGVSVLAAVAPPSSDGRDYDLASGTSMSAPHIAGLAAIVQGVHPRWTPMHIKSAMMTTATDLKDAAGAPSQDLFAQGAGHVNPKSFLDPGLFLLSDWEQWYGYISGLGLDTGVPAIEPNAVNLPSLAEGHVMTETTLTRTFTAARKGIWRVSVDVPGFSSTSSRAVVRASRAGQEIPVAFTFQRTSAPLSQWAFGHITMTGPTKVRLPVALRPVSVKAPTSVSGTGTAGSTNVPITGGFTGDLQVSTAGLVKGQVAEGALPEGDYALECVTIGAGNDLAQFDLVAPDSTSDLDMFVYAAESCDPNTIYAVAGEAATPSPGETFSLENAPAGTYIVEVDAFAAGQQGEPVPYSLRVYDLGGTPSVGGLAVDPNPVPVTTGGDTSFDVSWSGLEAESHYFGLLGYDGAPNSTYVYVDTTP